MPAGSAMDIPGHPRSRPIRSVDPYSCSATADTIRAAYQELPRHGAQGAVIHSDDTDAKILEFMGAASRPTRRASVLPFQRLF